MATKAEKVDKPEAVGKPAGHVRLQVINGQVIHNGHVYPVGKELSLPTEDAQRLLTAGVVIKA